jgi:DNA polymerase III epsilon subunit-like protein
MPKNMLEKDNRIPKFVVIDTETTGVYPPIHGLIQTACLVLDQKLEIINTFCVDICPPKDKVIDKEALKVSGFDETRIAKGISYKDFANQFTKFLSTYFSPQNKANPIGQYYPFDHAFLYSVFTELGLQERLSDLISREFLDTKVIANFINQKAILQGKEAPFTITSLSKPGGLKDVLKVGQNHQAHDALGDCMATLEVLKALLKY